MKRGKLIVIDGGDGSGKTIQAKLLIQHFKKRGIRVKYFDFPQYDSFYGKLVAQFLRGEFGDIESVSPYLATLPYALDRAAVQKQMSSYLNKGIYIISNRYVTSMAHQIAKFTTSKEKKEFVNWVTELEYKVNGMPKEDIVIYLYVPLHISIDLTKKKTSQAHLQGMKEDIHERDYDYRQKAIQTYLDLVKKFPYWVKIDCCENEHLLPPEKILDKIITQLQIRNILPPDKPSKN